MVADGGPVSASPVTRAFHRRSVMTAMPRCRTPTRDRTWDPPIKSRLLCQLSYEGVTCETGVSTGVPGSRQRRHGSPAGPGFPLHSGLLPVPTIGLRLYGERFTTWQTAVCSARTLLQRRICRSRTSDALTWDWVSRQSPHPHQESNLDLRFRRPPSCPLDHKGLLLRGPHGNRTRHPATTPLSSPQAPRAGVAAFLRTGFEPLSQSEVDSYEALGSGRSHIRPEGSCPTCCLGVSGSDENDTSRADSEPQAPFSSSHDRLSGLTYRLNAARLGRIYRILEDIVTDLRGDLRDVFGSIMEEKFKQNPEDLGILKTPIGEFADAAADMIGAMPSPPRYHAGEVQPSFWNALTAAELARGAQFDSVSAHFDEKSGDVVIVLSVGETGKAWNAGLPPETAERFAHQMLAVVRHAREQAGS